MKIKTSKKALYDSLARCAQALEAKPALPVLENVLITEGAIVSTDLGRAVTSRIEFSGKPGSILVGARRLTERVNALPDGEVSLTVKDGDMTIKGGNRTFKLQTASPESFPDVPESAYEWVEHRTADVVKAIDGAVYASSDDATRMHVASVLFEAEPDSGSLRTVGTDGHRLATHLAECAWSFGTVLIAKPYVQSLRKFIDGSDSVELSRDGQRLFARIGGDTMSVKLTDAEFPPWRQVFGNINSRSRLTVSGPALADALTAVSIASGERMGRVIFRASGGEMVLESNHANEGESRDAIACDGETETSIACNASYLVQAIKSIESEEVAIETSGEIDPIVVKDGETMRSVIMPRRQ